VLSSYDVPVRSCGCSCDAEHSDAQRGRRITWKHPVLFSAVVARKTQGVPRHRGSKTRRNSENPRKYKNTKTNKN